MAGPAISRKRSTRSEEVRAIFEADFRSYQYRFVEFFIEHLSDASRCFEGDLQEMIVLALVGQVRLRAHKLATDAGDDLEGITLQRMSISASRIADVTGIPRETVRRKLAKLEGRGWITRTGDGCFILSVSDGDAAARRDLSGLNARALERVARLFSDLERIVESSSPLTAEKSGEAAQVRHEPSADD